jgi:hypothetical protein
MIWPRLPGLLVPLARSRRCPTGDDERKFRRAAVPCRQRHDGRTFRLFAVKK